MAVCKNVEDTMLNKPKSYKWDRKPLWGYVNEADPYVMEMEIEAAMDHGVIMTWLILFRGLAEWKLHAKLLCS